MKKATIKAAALTLILVLGFSSVNVFATQSVRIQSDLSERGSLSVIGNGSVMAEPDMAIVNIGVEFTADSAREAQVQAAEAIALILEALDEAGVAPRDIQTLSYSMFPRFDHTMVWISPMPVDPVKVGYTVVHILNITIRDIDDVGEIIEAATTAGANRTSNVIFDITNREELYLEALELAIADGVRKAQAIAGVLDITIGVPSSISEHSGWHAPRAFMSFDTSGAWGDPVATSIQGGTIEITANVGLTFSYALD